MSRAPSPIAFAPAAHAVEMQRFGPVQPSWMPMIPAVAFAIIIGTKNGLTRSGPFSRYTLTCSSSVMSPPMPVPVMTAHACRVGAGVAGVGERVGGRGEAELRPRSTRRLSFGPRYGTGSKSRTSQPKLTARSHGVEAS